MNAIDLISFGTSSPADIETVRKLPAYRKATPSMAMAAVALEKALKPVENFFRSQPERFAMVLTSDAGELETTIDFLKTLDDSGLARPLLFQNSLHSATSGFLSIQFGLTAPVITASGFPFGPERALEIADHLLSGHQCDFVLLVNVEYFSFLNQELVPKNKAVDVGMCFLLARHDDIPSDLPWQTTLSDLAIQDRGPSSAPWSASTLDENILYQFTQSFEKTSSGEINIEKAQGSSRLKWRKDQ
jgi:hypothetical protein